MFCHNGVCVARYHTLASNYYYFFYLDQTKNLKTHTPNTHLLPSVCSSGLFNSQIFLFLLDSCVAVLYVVCCCSGMALLLTARSVPNSNSNSDISSLTNLPDMKGTHLNKTYLTLTVAIDPLANHDSKMCLTC